MSDRSDIVRRLLEAGASANETDRRGQTSFHLAVKNGDADCLSALIDSSARPPDIDALSYDGRLKIVFSNFKFEFARFQVCLRFALEMC